MPSPAPKSTKTDQFERMGHTTGPFGNSPDVEPMGEVAAPPKEIKP